VEDGFHVQPNGEIYENEVHEHVGNSPRRFNLWLKAWPTQAGWRVLLVADEESSKVKVIFKV
jgi:uncharacterized protein YbdZ (MbtH family)